MFSLKTSVFFFSCIAVAVAFPHFFNMATRNPDRERNEPEEQYRNAAGPFNQQAGQSSVFSEADVTAEVDSNSAEEDAAGSLGGDGADDDGSDREGSEVDTPDSPDTGGAVVSGDAQQGGVGNNAGDTSSTPSPNVVGGGPGLIVNSGKGSSPGAKFGIAFAVLTVVGLAAGGAFYAYKKRREASYGSRF